MCHGWKSQSQYVPFFPSILGAYEATLQCIENVNTSNTCSPIKPIVVSEALPPSAALAPARPPALFCRAHEPLCMLPREGRSRVSDSSGTTVEGIGS
jgi:hypothetical protein